MAMEVLKETEIHTFIGGDRLRVKEIVIILSPLKKGLRMRFQHCLAPMNS